MQYEWDELSTMSCEESRGGNNYIGIRIYIHTCTCTNAYSQSPPGTCSD